MERNNSFVRYIINFRKSSYKTTLNFLVEELAQLFRIYFGASFVNRGELFRLTHNFFNKLPPPPPNWK